MTVTARDAFQLSDVQKFSSTNVREEVYIVFTEGWVSLKIDLRSAIFRSFILNLLS